MFSAIDIAIVASESLLAANIPDLIASACSRQGLSVVIIQHEQVLSLCAGWWQGARVVYFLVEEEWVQANAARIEATPVRVLNIKYSAKKLLKPQTLALLRSAGNPVLPHYDSQHQQPVRKALESGEALVAKSSLHRQWHHVVESVRDYEELSQRYSGQPWYLERFIRDRREFKSYAIGELVGFGQPLSSEAEQSFMGVIGDIMKRLELDVASFDVLEDASSGARYIIDVNAAPGFVGLKNGADIFASFLATITRSV